MNPDPKPIFTHEEIVELGSAMTTQMGGSWRNYPTLYELAWFDEQYKAHKNMRRKSAREKDVNFLFPIYCDVEAWLQGAINKLLEGTISLSDRRAGVSHAKNLLAVRASKNLEEVQYFKDCYEALRQETSRYRNRASMSMSGGGESTFLHT